MKILHVIASIAPRYGGSSNAAVHLCREIVNLGHEVGVLTTNIAGKQNLDVPLAGRRGKLGLPSGIIYSEKMGRAMDGQVNLKSR